jgi:hypothetical protein
MGAALAATSVRAQEQASSAESRIEAIVNCLATGNEAVLASSPTCVPRAAGIDKALDAGMPLGGGDWDAVCHNERDPRRLPGDAIKQIASRLPAAVAPTGIRVIGAVFCGDLDRPPDSRVGLDLAGLDLPYSLILDGSLVNGSIDARNLRVKGDFSFNNVVILRSLDLDRARIDGSVNGEKSFVDRLMVSDTAVTGSWWQPDSILFTDAQIHRVHISGDLRMDGAAFSRLWLLSTSVAGTLVLDKAEARCAFHIDASTLGYLTATDVGFGHVVAVGPQGYLWWSPSRLRTGDLFASATINSIAAGHQTEVADQARAPGTPRMHGCAETTNSKYVEFYIFDSTVQSALCLNSFAWLTLSPVLQVEDQPITILAIDGTRVRGNLIIKLWADPIGGIAPGDRPDDALASKRDASMRKFEAVGLTAGALIFDFTDKTQPYFTYLDGLKFDRIHKANPVCTKQTDGTTPARPMVAGPTATPAPVSPSSQVGLPGFSSQLALPSTDDVLDWLAKNEARSSQPFMAFVAAFEQAGEGATQLRIERRTIDLCAKTWPFLRSVLPACRDRGGVRSDEETDGAPAETSQAGVLTWLTAPQEFFSRTAELATTGFQWMLYLLADHGLRPGKVLWSVIITLLVFSGFFWFLLGIIGFEPKTKDSPPGVVWPISFLFLFDRLIPAYKIREEHYAIGRVYRRATKAEIKAAASGAGAPPSPMRYLGMTFWAWPADDAKLHQAEKWLTVLRVVGTVFAVFLLAAINTLAGH